jgi:hypothetical protein
MRDKILPVTGDAKFLFAEQAQGAASRQTYTVSFISQKDG